MDSVSQRRQELKQRLVDAAAARIASGGLAGLRARDVTADAGCALGALYNVFSDLDDLVVHVNSQTLARLRDEVDRASPETDAPRERLVGLALGYLAFAQAEPALWMALFEHRMPAGHSVPDWHLQEHAALIEQIAAPLAALQPGLDHTALAIRARTLFSAVHGVVSMGLGDWFVGPGTASVAKELRIVVEAMLSGLQGGSGG